MTKTPNFKTSPTSKLWYTETILPQVSSLQNNNDERKWLDTSLGTIPKRWSKGKGVPSLEEMALRTLLCNLQGLDVLSFEGVGVVWVERVWRNICSRKLESIRLFQLFTQVLPTNPPLHHRSYIKEPLVLGPLHTILAPLSSPSLTWLISLTLISVRYDPTSLLSLAHLPNLTYLHIAGSHSKQSQSITDDIFRRWNRQAVTENGFLGLKVLVLRFQKGVTEKSVGFLGGFKKLQVFCTSRCGVRIRQGKKVARGVGWKMTRHSLYAHIKSSFSQPNEELKTHQGKGWRSWTKLIEEFILSQQTETEANKPLLSLQLGVGLSREAAVLEGLEDIECWVRNEDRVEKEEGNAEEKGQDRKGKEKRQMSEDSDPDPKRRKIRDRKKLELLDLLQGM